jgi:hypothetical protein
MNRAYVLATLLLMAAITTASAADDDWQQQIASALGKPGIAMPGNIYRVGMPRTDLTVTLDGVQLKPAFALGSWLAFKRLDDQVMAMGDLALTDAEVNPVMTRLAEAGIEITAIHNHLLRADPNTMYMHVLGHGDPGRLAAAFRYALAASGTPLSDAAQSLMAPPLELDTTAIDAALGRKGQASGGVYQVSIPRAEPVREHGMDVPASMGSAIAINFQPTGKGNAAITGDFVLAADEVNPALRAMREHGIEVTALHSHMLMEQPRLFFMHFWGNDDALKLAKGLRAALDEMNIAKN